MSAGARIATYIDGSGSIILAWAPLPGDEASFLPGAVALPPETAHLLAAELANKAKEGQELKVLSNITDEILSNINLDDTI